MYKDYLSHEVVLDVNGSVVYLGVLCKVDEDYLELSPVDVHDVNDGKSNKESYIRASREGGIRFNREVCRVSKSQVISLTRLQDVLNFPG
jgi:hypothetical protein